jgi:hypothetical protein
LIPVLALAPFPRQSNRPEIQQKLPNTAIEPEPSQQIETAFYDRKQRKSNRQGRGCNGQWLLIGSVDKKAPLRNWRGEAEEKEAIAGME